jgi:hypothetical protein
MKKTCFFLFAFCLFQLVNAQEQQTINRHITLKWAPTGLILGSFSLQGEYNFGKNSLTAKIGLPVSAHHSFDYENDDADFNLKGTSFLAGYRMYLSKRHLRGIYFEPFFKYVHHTSEGAANSTLGSRPVRFGFTNDYNGAGIGAQLGAQFLIKNRVVIDFFFLGPEINSSTNDFKAIELTSTIPWNTIEANDAEQEIKDFIDEFPFIRNKTKVMVDPNNRSVFADFKGALPGMRIGVSFGVAF